MEENPYIAMLQQLSPESRKNLTIIVADSEPVTGDVSEIVPSGIIIGLRKLPGQRVNQQMVAAKDIRGIRGIE